MWCGSIISKHSPCHVLIRGVTLRPYLERQSDTVLELAFAARVRFPIPEPKRKGSVANRFLERLASFRVRLRHDWFIMVQLPVVLSFHQPFPSRKKFEAPGSLVINLETRA